MDVEVLLFDVGGTVFDWRSAVIDALSAVGSHDLGALDPEAFGTQWRTQSLIEIEAIADQSAAWRPFDPVLESSLDHTLAAFGVASLSADDRARLLAAWEAMPVLARGAGRAGPPARALFPGAAHDS